MKYTLAIKHNGLLRKIPGTKYFVVMEEFCWYVDYEKKKGKIIVDEGFTTDFASVPRLLWIFLNPTKYIAPILHDYLYRYKELPRDEADMIFLEALNVEGANIFEKTCYYWGVRVGGWVAYYFNKN